VIEAIARRGRAAEQSFSYWVVYAMFDAGQEQWALDYLRALWGAQLQHPSWNGTFHEAWDSPWGSTSHAWSAGPTALLPEKIAGLAPLAPGWRRFEVRPHLGDLAWAKARVATVAGDVAASWRRTSAGLELDVLVPPGASADVTPPRFGQGRVELDGALVWPRPTRPPVGLLIVDGRPTIRVGAGTHHLRVK
jgi:hypothetical protein